MGGDPGGPGWRGSSDSRLAPRESGLRMTEAVRLMSWRSVGILLPSLSYLCWFNPINRQLPADDQSLL